MITIKQIIYRFRKNKKQTEPNESFHSDLATIALEEGKTIPLHEMGDQLTTLNRIKAKGTWGPRDFNLFKKKLKTGLSSLAANIVLQEVDFGEIILSNDTSEEMDLRNLFHFCVKLKTVILPDASDYEGKINLEGTFCGCSKLEKIKNLGTYQHIADLSGTFRYCSVLSELEFLPASLPKGNTKTFQHINRELKVTVPKGAKIPSNWSQIKPANILRK